MNRELLAIVLLVYSLILFTPEAYAVSCSSSSIPSGLASNTAYCIPISIGAGSSSSNAQVMVELDAAAYQSYLSGSLQNIYIYNGVGAYPVNAWIEGNSLNEFQNTNLNTATNVIIWINDPSANIISTSTDSNYYIGVATTGTNFFSNTIARIGEAPQLSSSYGQYDDGANVFSFYTGFKGSSTPSGFATFQATPTFNNGITFSSSDGGIYYTTMFTTPLVIEDLYTGPTVSGGTSYPQTALSYALDINEGSFVLGKGFAYIYADAPGSGKFGIESWTDGGSSRVSVNSVSQYPTANAIYGFVWPSTANEIAYTNYNQVSNAISSTFSFGAYNAVLSNAAGGASYTAQWFRGRVYPLGGTQPTVTLSAASAAVPTITLANSISQNAIDVIAGSASDNALVTATCSTGDTCQIWKVGGTSSLISGTTTASLAYNSLPLGYSSLYANDISLTSVSGNVLVRRINTVNSIPVNLINTQSSAIPSGAQLEINFAAHNYTVLESNTLNNTVVYFKNGTVAYSWLEGGVTGTIEYAANVLSISSNVFYWFKAPNTNSFLAADTGTATVNTVYIGFDIPQNNLMDGNFIGEAPQLSPIYAQYDNGANVFSYYLVNPKSTTGFTLAGSAGLSNSPPSGSYFDTPNAFQAAVGGNNNYMYGSNPAFYAGNVITYWTHIPLQALGDLFFASSSSGNGQFSRIDERSSYPTDSGFLSSSSWTSWSGGGNVQDPPAALWDKVDVVMATSTTAIMYTTPVANTPIATFGSNNTGTVSISNNGDYFGLQGDSAGSGIDYWDAIIVRDYLPGGVVPQSSSYPSSLYSAETISISPSRQTVIIGNNGAITDSGATGGISPYTYQWYATYGNVPTTTSANAMEANALLGIGTANGQAQSNNATFATNSMTSTGNYWFVVNVIDSYPTAVNSSAVELIVSSTPASTTTIPPCGGGICGSGGSGVEGQPTTVATTSISSSTTMSTTTQNTTSISTTTLIPITTIPRPPIDVSVTPVGQTTPQLCNGTSTGYSVNYASLGATFYVVSDSNGCFTITAVNATSIANVTGNNGQITVKAINFTISSADIYANATVSYPCGLHYYAIAPFILKNGKWEKITPFSVNAGACTISFAVPSDPIIGIFQNASALPPTSSTLQTTITAQQQPSGNFFWPAIVAAILIILLVIYYMRRKKTPSK